MRPGLVLLYRCKSRIHRSIFLRKVLDALHKDLVMMQSSLAPLIDSLIRTLASILQMKIGATAALTLEGFRGSVDSVTWSMLLVLVEKC